MYFVLIDNLIPSLVLANSFWRMGKLDVAVSYFDIMIEASIRETAYPHSILINGQCNRGINMDLVWQVCYYVHVIGSLKSSRRRAQSRTC